MKHLRKYTISTRAAVLSAALTMAAGLASGANGTWTSLSGGSWTNSANWSGGTIADGIGSIADFSTLGLTADEVVTLDAARTNGTLIFQDSSLAHNWTLNTTGTGSPLTLAASSGAPTITVNNQTATIALALASTQGLTKTGNGTLTLTGTNTCTGTILISGGVLNYNGAGLSTGSSGYNVGGANGRAAVNVNTSSSVVNAGGSYVGGTGGGADTGIGALNILSGTLNIGNNGNYTEIGSGGTLGNGSYGCVNLTGGTFSMVGSSGIRIGAGGLGVFNQTGGTLNCSRWFAIGTLAGGAATANVGGIGLANFLGGTAVISTSQRILLSDKSGAIGVLNIGTEAGGTANLSSLQGSATAGGIDFIDQGGAAAQGIFNFNRGTLQLAGPMYRNNSAGFAQINWNGGTLQLNANNIYVSVINNNFPPFNVYNGGAVIDTQGNTVTNVTPFVKPAGNGLYPSAGVLTISSGGGTGYIGLPYVSVTSSGLGSNAMAIARISGGVVTSVALTCPGQNYSVGDTLTFAFSGGGATTPASTFQYTLTANDLVANSMGGLTKLGTGTLVMTVPNSYQGSTLVTAGTLRVRVDGGLGGGNVSVANGATLVLENGALNNYLSDTGNLICGNSATVNLNFTGTDTVKSFSIDGGATYLAPGVYGAVGAAAANQDSRLTGTGLLNVLSVPSISVTVSSTPNPSVNRQAVTFTGLVGGNSGTPTGTVTFMDGTTVIKTVTLSAGSASATVSNLSVGSHSVTALYSGNASYSSAVSSSLLQIVGIDTDLWKGNASQAWDTTTTNWTMLGTPVNYLEGDNAQFDDSATGSAIVLNGTVSPSSVTFSNNVKNYTLSGSGVLAGATGLVKMGSGTLTLSNANTYGGNTIVSNGILTYAGSSSSSGNGSFNVGGPAGSGLVNFNSTGILSFGGNMSVGGYVGDTNDVASGGIVQTDGTFNCGSSGNYLELGAGGSGAYGYYGLSGGTLNMVNASGMRIGASGLGVLMQNGGTLNCTRWFSVGSATGGGTVGGQGVATIAAGTLTVSSGYRIIIGDKPFSTGILSIGTEAGGAPLVTAVYNGGGIIMLGDNSSSGAALNFNSGTLQLGGAITRNIISGGDARINFNGGTLQAMSDNISLIDGTLESVNLYKGGLIVDSQAFNVTNAANMQSAPGNGIYIAGGTLPIASGGGSGYVGAPNVSVSGGSGYASMAVANVVGGVVKSVAMTSPGIGYQPGDTIRFDFAGGGTATPAGTFSYLLKASDVADNTTGGLTKIGTGTLTLTGGNAYTGPAVVSAGKLVVSSSPNGDYKVADHATLKINVGSQDAQLPMTSLAFTGPTSSALGFDLRTAGNLSTVTAPVSVSGTLSATGTVNLGFDISGISVGQYPLIQYGSLSGSGSFTITNLPVGVTAYLITNTTVSPRSLDLMVTSSGQPRWDGQVNGVQNGTWDINTTYNWVDMLTFLPTSYQEGRPALFDDSLTGTSTITVAANVHPGSVTFSNNTTTYTLVGTKKISGTTGLLKMGSGETIIANTPNDYTGSTVVAGGTLTVTNLGNGGVASAIGASTASASSLVLSNGGALHYTGPAVAINRGYTVGLGGGTLNLDGDVSVSGQPVTTSGANFTKSGPAKLTYTAAGTNVLSTGGAGSAFGVAAGAVVLNGTSGSQTNIVTGDLWVGFSGTNSSSLVLSNSSLSISTWLAVDRGNGNGGQQSFVSAYNSILSCGNISLGYDNALPLAARPTLNLFGNSRLTSAGLLNLGESAGADASLTVADSAVLDNSLNNVLIGNATSRGVLNLNSTATSLLALNNVSLRVGGNGGAADTGVGAINQTAGTFSFGNGAGNYLELGAGGSSYGSFNLSGGTASETVSAGIRVGAGGLGSFVQSGGSLYCGRWFAIGTLTGALTNGGSGVATFTGGSAMINPGNRFIVGDKTGSSAALNIGTLAGGTAQVTNLGSVLTLNGDAGATNSALNLNSGTLQLGGAISRANTAVTNVGVVNLNGGTLQAGVNNMTLIDTSLSSVNVYKGGAVVDSMANAATISASLVAASGNGIYPAGGTIAVPSNGGSGYLGAPLVSVNGGSGLGALAIAKVVSGVVTGVTLTCPGHGYAAGDQVNFGFNGGGAKTVANTFTYTLQPADLAANSTGGFTKLGTGSLTLSGANSYTGNTVISNGTLVVGGSLLSSTVTVATGGTLSGSGVVANAVTLNSGATLAPGNASIGLLTINNKLTCLSGSTNYVRLNKTLGTNDSVRGMTQAIYAGTLTVANIAGVLAANDSFKLFDATVYTGSFSSVVPATPGTGLAWDTSRLAVDGTLKIVSGVNTSRTNITATVSGGNLTLSWPSDHTGWTLQVQTNTLAVGISNNWFAWPGSTTTNRVILPINVTNPTVFYRLSY